MIDNLGISFSPLNNPTFAGGQGQNAGQHGSVPLADAIRMLSLRIPRVVGARGIAPQALLNAPGVAGVPPDVMMLLRQLFGQFSLAPSGEERSTSPYSQPMASPTSPYSQPMASPTAPYSQMPPYTYPAPNITPGGSVPPGEGPVDSGSIITAPLAPTSDYPTTDYTSAIASKLNYQQNPWGF